jgi:hypothetical protein
VTGHYVGWHEPSDVAMLKEESGNWTFRGDISVGDFAPAGVVCVDFPYGSVVDSGWLGPSRTGYISAAPGYGTVCGLTGIGGPFDVATWTDGAMIDWPKSTTDLWSLTTSSKQSAMYACVH